MGHTAKIGLAGLAFCIMQACGATFSIDVDTGIAGIQPVKVFRDTGAVIVAEFSMAGTTDLFSYQFSVQYDTARFKYLDGNKDYGFSGTRNLLATNGGSVQGICQKRTNPDRPDIIDLAYTITGSDAAMQVSGSGLVGVLYFKSKMGFGDSGEIKIISGSWASLNGILAPVDTLSCAKVRMAAPCSLTVRHTVGGFTTPPGIVLGMVGDTVIVKAAAELGYVFKTWKVITGTAVLLNAVNDSTGLIVNSGFVEVQADFDTFSAIAAQNAMRLNVLETRSGSRMKAFNLSGRLVYKQSGRNGIHTIVIDAGSKMKRTIARNYSRF